VIIPDVNVIVAAFRVDDPRHQSLKAWLARVMDGAEAVALTEAICAAYVRIVTHPRIFAFPTTTALAFDHIDLLRRHPNAIVVGPATRHWELLRQLCLAADIRGGHVTDAHHAAVAIEHGATFVTLDRGFGRFPGLRWRSPLDS